MLVFLVAGQGKTSITHGFPDFFIQGKEIRDDFLINTDVIDKLYSSVGRPFSIGLIGEKHHEIYKDPKRFKPSNMAHLVERGKGYYAALS